VTAFDTLALFARNDRTRQGLCDADERRGLAVDELGADAESVHLASGAGTAFRAPGGLLALALERGADVRMFGPTAEWFIALGQEITGRLWEQVAPASARAMLRSVPAFIKLADAKIQAIPTRRYARRRGARRRVGRSHRPGSGPAAGGHRLAGHRLGVPGVHPRPGC